MSFERTDFGNAQLLAHLYGNHLRYDWEHQKWLFWKDYYWQEQKGHGILNSYVMKCANHRISEAAGDKDEIKFALSSKNYGKTANTIEFAKGIYPIDGSDITWNSRNHLLACKNKVINLRTGEISEPNPKDYISLHTEVEYKPEAQCPRWIRHLNEVFNEDQELIDFVQRAFGYSLTGETREQVLFICVGSGANGKGKTINTIISICGEYSHTLPLNAIDSRTHNPFALAGLVDRRIATASEMGEKLQLDSGRIKALTGEDPFTTSHKYKPEFTFYPKAKFWLLTNHLPEVMDNSTGFWRRIMVIPFEREFTGQNRDNFLEEKLYEESSGILNWIIQGAVSWYKDGLKPPIKVLLKTQQYRNENDLLSAFIYDKCSLGDELRIQSRDLYQAYTAWMDSEGYSSKTILTETAFGRNMKIRFNRKSFSDANYYMGLTLRDLVGVS